MKKIPCRVCRRLRWAGKGTLPAGQLTCRECRAKARGTCAGCGGVLPTYTHVRYCSDACRYAVPVPLCESCGGEVRKRHKRKGWERFCSRSCAMRMRPRPEPKPRSVAIRYGDCSECGATFIRRPASKRTCGPTCSRRRNARVSAQRVMGLYRLALRSVDVPKAMVWRSLLVGYLRDRDGEGCALCPEPMRFDLASGPRGDDRGVSIDHVIPWSEGGADDLQNLRLAHWGCNRARRVGGGNEQLRLVG